MGRLMSYLFSVAVLLAALSGGPLQAQMPDSGSPAPLNPEFLKYSQDFAAGRLQTMSESGRLLGLIPDPVDLSHMTGQQVHVAQMELAASLPASYDLCTQSPARLTPVRDQANCGSCWAFATYGSLESCLMPSQSSDFSENNLKNTHGFDWSCCYGGNYSMSTAYMARWSGPISETDDPYNPGSCASPLGLAPVKHVQNVYYIPNRSGPLDNDNLKYAVMNLGAVSTSLYWSDTYYNLATHAYYYSGSNTSNHGVCIVGWDDNYDKTRFPSVPPGNGAFIVRNSWGTGFGENGYFYCSYYDPVIGTGNFLFYGIEDSNNFDRVYQYDPLGWCGCWGWTGSNTAWFANVFTSAANEQLTAVSWYSASANSTYTLYVYLDPGSGPRTGTLVATRSGGCSAPGYHTFSVVPSVALTAGHKFSIVVQLTTPGYDYPIPLECPYAGYSSGATANAGESFYSHDGTNWWDITASVPSANVCLKAFTKDVSQFGGSYVYWVPYVEQTAAGPSETWNYVYLRADENGTSVSVDFNHDGVSDVTANLNITDWLLLGGPHNTVEGTVPGLLPGTRITSNKPLVAIYRFLLGDFGKYEDGMLWYSLPTAAVLGEEFWLPFSAQKTALVGTANGTEVTVDTNGDGVPDQTLTLGYGETAVLADLPAGSHLSSSNDVGAVAMAYGGGFYDNTYAVTLIPTNLWKTCYFVPLNHPYNYQNATDLSRVLVVGGQDGTSVNVGGQNLSCNRGQVLSVNLTGEAQIQSSAPIYAVYVSDILATDPWDGVRNYAYAHNLPSNALKVNETTIQFSSLDGNGAPLIRMVIAGLSANTHINLDINADGAVDRTETLGQGEFLYLDERDPSLSGRLVRITADAGFAVVRSWRSWWQGISETTAAAEDLPVDVAVTNTPPAVSSLSDTPDPVRLDGNLRLSAGGVTDPDGAATITDVKFCRESNGTPGLQTGAGGDALVGTDSSGDGGWTATIAITGLVAGDYTYYAQATDNQGAVSNVATTTSTVQTGLTISEAKLLPDGGPVETGGAIISASWSDSFYIEADDRSSGIRVEKNSHGLTKDKRANVTGIVRTNVDGERYIEASDAIEWGNGTVAPLGMANRAVGGGDWRYQEITGAGQRGLEHAFGLNNIGLLVRVLGCVTASGADSDPRYPFTWLYLDDGSNVQDGTGIAGLYCASALALTPPPVGSYVCVTGVSSCEFYRDGLVNVVRVPALEDIIVVPSAESVSTPGTPTGDQSPKQDYGPYPYSTTGATCSLGHQVEYSFNWGDGTSSGWSTSTSASHSWNTSGPRTITVTARCQVHTSVSATSLALTINVIYWPL